MSEVLDRLRVAEAALADVRRLLEAAKAEPAPPPPSRGPGLDDASSLFDPAAFFNAIRSSKALGPSLTSGEVTGCEAILAACAGFPASWAAYALATAVVETAGTMQPIKEMGGAAYFRRMYDIEGERPAKAKELGNLTPGDGARYCGRGYVQLTGRANYAKAEAALGVPLVADPDLALGADTAAKIMRRGMQEGWFTGKSLSSYLPATADIHQFTNARRIINGQDRAIEIAGYALEFQAALAAGGWS